MNIDQSLGGFEAERTLIGRDRDQSERSAHQGQDERDLGRLRVFEGLMCCTKESLGVMNPEGHAAGTSA